MSETYASELWRFTGKKYQFAMLSSAKQVFCGQLGQMLSSASLRPLDPPPSLAKHHLLQQAPELSFNAAAFHPGMHEKNPLK